MSTSLKDIKGWLGRKKSKHTHMLVVCDTFDYDDYPVFVTKDESVHERISHYSGNMQKVMEVYNLKISIPKQLKESRSWNT